MAIIPVSVRARAGEPSLCDMPTEIRLNICECLLNINNTASTYGYTGPLLLNRKPSLHKHGMVIVSKQLSAEYCQAFYERTKFFLRIDSQNVFMGIPSQVFKTHPNPEPPFPNFWDAPDALLVNLRHCTLFVELGESACYGASMHALSRKAKPGTDTERRWAQGVAFDKAIKGAVGRLLEGMRQLRSVQLVWETTAGDTQSNRKEDWSWEEFGDPFVKKFQEKWTMKSFRVRVGDKYEDVEWRGERVKEGKWEVGPIQL